MKMNDMVKKGIESLKGTEDIKNLTKYMQDHNIKIDEWKDTDVVSDDVHKLLEDYFKGNVKEQDSKVEENTDKTDNMNLEEFRNLKKTNTLNNQDTNKPVVESKRVIKAKYKKIDNLLNENTKAQDTIFTNVRKVTDELYTFDITGGQLASMFLNEKLIYDPSMQRGAKINNKGEIRAVFTDKHVKEIADSMTKGTFTQFTQIHLALIIDDKDLSYNMVFNDETNENDLHVHGITRILDGQHRTRACVKLHCEAMADAKDEDGEDIEDLDLNLYIFSVVVHAISADRARMIYGNINKQLKLDKSQVRELQSDDYAKVVKILNTNSDYELYQKVSSRRPVGDRIVLFSTFAESLENNVKIRNTDERDETIKYLNEFFKYVAKKLPNAFGSDGKERVKFKENNLLNENNFFPTWIKIAFMDKENYKKNIDIISRHFKFFNKDYKETRAKEYYWEALTVVKKKTGVKAKGFAVNNSNTGISKITEETLKLISKYNKSTNTGTINKEIEKTS